MPRARVLQFKKIEVVTPASIEDELEIFLKDLEKELESIPPIAGQEAYLTWWQKSLKACTNSDLIKKALQNEKWRINCRVQPTYYKALIETIRERFKLRS